MHIAFDARPLIGPRTGVGVWLEGLLRGLAAAGDWTFSLRLPRAVTELGLDPAALRAERDPSPVPLPGTVWLTTLAGPRLGRGADAYVATLGVLPRRLEVPSVLVVHDLTPFTRPAQHTLANRFCFNAYFEASLADADVVVCDSAATRSRLIRHFPAAGRRALVVRPGVDPFFTPAPDGSDGEGLRARFSAGRPYVVQLGTLEPRKGVATLVDAHGRLLARRPDAPDLVLAGGRGWGGDWLSRALARHPDPARVHRPGYVSRDDARDLLRHAEVVVTAAEEEGFGLPLAEALACGAACVASDEPALMEVSDGAALHAPRGDAAALAHAMDAVLEPAERERRRRLALARGRELGWAGPVEEWRKLLEGLTLSHDAAARHRRT